jgi:NaMN:DMB phosphoribosyltransferase
VHVTTSSPARLAAIAIGSGAALGAVSLLIVRYLPHPLNLLGTLGGPWVATAFGVGSFARRRSWAALAGAASMAAAATAYYFLRTVVHPGAFGGFTVGGEAIN